MCRHPSVQGLSALPWPHPHLLRLNEKDSRKLSSQPQEDPNGHFCTYVVCFPPLPCVYICLLSQTVSCWREVALFFLLCVLEASGTVPDARHSMHVCGMNEIQNDKHKGFSPWLIHFCVMAHFSSKAGLEIKGGHSIHGMFSQKEKKKLGN